MSIGKGTGSWWKIRLSDSRVVVYYLVFGVAWMVLSEALWQRVASRSGSAPALQTLKGLFFVAVTGIFLLVLIRRHLRRVRSAC